MQRIRLIGLLLVAMWMAPAGACQALERPVSDGFAETARGEEGAAAETRWAAFEAIQALIGYPQHPTISPDGSIIVFVSADDLWAVPAEGGAATRLTAHPAEEGRSAFSPDGTMLAFESDRDGTRNLYVMSITSSGGQIVGGPIERVTTSDRAQMLTGWTPEGDALLFTSTIDPAIYRVPRMYRVPLDGGPIELVTEAHGRTPRISQDGRSLLFTRGRWDWTRPAYRGSGGMNVHRLSLEDGSFSQLTSFDGNDGDAYPLPDGSVVFVSSRDGQNNVWRLTPGATDGAWNRGQRGERSGLIQLTDFQPGDEATIGHGVHDLSVSWDGRWAVFVVWDTIYRLDLSRRGARPEPVRVWATPDSHGRDEQQLDLSSRVDEAALSPDGKTVAVVARGEVFVRSTDSDRPTRRVTHTYGRERDLAWSPDNRHLYFASDEEGHYAIYRASVTLSREDLAPTEDAPERTEEKQEEEEPTEPEPAPEPDPALPPDPDVAWFDADFLVEEEGRSALVSRLPARLDDEPEKKEEKKKEEKVDHGKRWAGALRFQIEPFVKGEQDKRSPMPSPDGRWMLYVRGLGDLVLVDLGTMEERVLFEGWDEPEVEWMNDSHHIVYAVTDLYFNRNIFILNVHAEPGTPEAEPVNVTRHPGYDFSPRVSADGKFLVFLSDRQNDAFQYDVWAVFLDKKLEGMRSYELDEYFERAARQARQRKPIDPVDFDKEPEKTEPFEFDLDDAYLRARRVANTPSRASNLALTPGGDRIIFMASIDGSMGLHSVDHRGRNRRLIQSGGGLRPQPSLTGQRVLYIRSSQAAWATPTGGSRETLGIDARITIETEKQQRQKFLEASRILGNYFYHPTLKGLDWDALTRRYKTLALRTRTTAEFNRVVQMLFGELNGSHTGIRGGPSYSAPSPRNGYLGVETEPAGDGYRVTRVVPGSPADQHGSRLDVGDVILSIDGRPLNEDGRLIDLHGAMAGLSGQEILLEVRRADELLSPYVLIIPISYGALNNLAYEDEVQRRRELVEELSGGRLGYLHIRGMNTPAVHVFERDLYAAASGKDGLIIDVRDNGGGRTTDILLTSLTAPAHAYTVPRGADPDEVPWDAYPRDRRLMYAYKRPLSVLINENSFSNAEIFAHAIRNIDRGKLVGTATFGGVISTGSASLIDGTTVRRPGRGWYTPDGTDMENNGAQPHIPVPMTPEAEVNGDDPQIRAAVEELLERIDAGNDPWMQRIPHWRPPMAQ